MDVSRRELMLTGAALAALAKGGSALALAQEAAGGGGTAAWDLTDLYPNDAAWAAERQSLSRPRSRGCRSYAVRSAGTPALLRTALQTISDTFRKAVRLYIYASLKADEDLRVAPNQERKQQAQDVFTALGEATAWVEPEILTVGEAKVEPVRRRRARPRQVPLLPRQHPAPGAAHARPRNRSACWPASGSAAVRAQRHSRPARLLRHSPARSHPVDRADRPARRPGLFDQPLRAQSRRPQTGLRPLLGELQDVRKLARRGARLQGARRHLPVQGAPLRQRAAMGAGRRQYPGGRLPDPGRRGQSAACRCFTAISRFASACSNLPDLHYYDIYPPLVRNDRRFTLADMRTTTLEALRPLGPEYGRLLAQAHGGALDGSLPPPGQGLGRLYERRRLRRSPLSAAQPGRQL